MKGRETTRFQKENQKKKKRGRRCLCLVCKGLGAENQGCNDLRKSASHICDIPQNDQSQLRLLVVVNKTQIYSINTRCGTHHTLSHITQLIKLGALQSPPLKSLMSSLGLTLQSSVSEPTRGCQANSDTIYNDPRKSANYIYAIP